jgi:hypothetical protein
MHGQGLILKILSQGFQPSSPLQPHCQCRQEIFLTRLDTQLICTGYFLDRYPTQLPIAEMFAEFLLPCLIQQAQTQRTPSGVDFTAEGAVAIEQLSNDQSFSCSGNFLVASLVVTGLPMTSALTIIQASKKYTAMARSVDHSKMLPPACEMLKTNRNGPANK